MFLVFGPGIDDKVNVVSMPEGALGKFGVIIAPPYKLGIKAATVDGQRAMIGCICTPEIAPRITLQIRVDLQMVATVAVKPIVEVVDPEIGAPLGGSDVYFGITKIAC